MAGDLEALRLGGGVRGDGHAAGTRVFGEADLGIDADATIRLREIH